MSETGQCVKEFHLTLLLEHFCRETNKHPVCTKLCQTELAIIEPFCIHSLYELLKDYCLFTQRKKCNNLGINNSATRARSRYFLMLPLVLPMFTDFQKQSHSMIHDVSCREIVLQRVKYYLKRLVTSLSPFHETGHIYKPLRQPFRDWSL